MRPAQPEMKTLGVKSKKPQTIHLWLFTMILTPNAMFLNALNNSGFV